MSAEGSPSRPLSLFSILKMLFNLFSNPEIDELAIVGTSLFAPGIISNNFSLPK